MKDYIDILKELRIDNDISQKQIADLLNTTQTAVSKYENRQRKLSIEDLKTLCEFYRISADKILNLNNEQ